MIKNMQSYSCVRHQPITPSILSHLVPSIHGVLRLLETVSASLDADEVRRPDHSSVISEKSLETDRFLFQKSLIPLYLRIHVFECVYFSSMK